MKRPTQRKQERLLEACEHKVEKMTGEQWMEIGGAR